MTQRTSHSLRRLLVALVGMGATLAVAPQAGAHAPHDDISDIAVSPRYEDDQTIHVITRGRLSASEDGGRTWREVSRGLGRSIFSRLDRSRADDDLLFMSSRGDGVFRSEDGGHTWSASQTGLDATPLADIAASPTSDGLVFVAGAALGLFRSTDGGRSWSAVDGFDRVTALAFANDGSGRVLAGEGNGRLRVSEDDGDTWEEIISSSGTDPLMAITAGAGDTADLVVVAGADGEVWRSEDGGRSFEHDDRDPVADEPVGVVMSEDGETLWVSTWNDGVVRSEAPGEAWEETSEGLTKSEQADQFELPHFRGIATVPGSEELLLAGFDGLFRSDDGTGPWHPVETAADFISGLAVSPALAEDGTVVVMTYVKGGFISDDGGDTWEPMNEGLLYDELSEGNRLFPLRRAHNVVLSPAFSEDHTMYSATWPQLIMSTDAGATWTEVQIEEPTADWSPLRQYVLAVSPDHARDNTIFAGNRHGQTFRSEARGVAGSWQEIGSVDGRVRSFAISPSFADDGTIFVSAVGGVFESDDGGDTWTRTGPGKSTRATGAETDPAPLLAISPEFGSDGTVFAGTDSGLFVTRDGGDSWTEISGGPVRADSDVAAIGVSPAFGDDGIVLVSVQGEGLYRSTDGGLTFEAIGTDLIEADRVIADYENPTSLPIQFSTTFAADQTVYAYAGPDVLRSTDGGDTWDILELPSIEDVAESLGVEVDALSLHQGHPASPALDEPSFERRWTVDTPAGMVSARRLVAAGAVALASAVAAWWLARRLEWSGRTRAMVALGAFVLVGLVATTVLAA